MDKKKFVVVILTILMWFVGIKGTISVLSDNNTAHYNNLPMWVVYFLLAVYMIATILVTVRAVRKLKYDK